MSNSNPMGKVRIDNGSAEGPQNLDRLPEIDPFSPAYKTDPLAAIERVRAQSPLARSVRGLEVLTYDACAEVYANENYESASPLIAASMGLDFSLLMGPGRTMTNSEGEDHAVLRRTVSKWFTPRRVRELRPAVVDLVKQRIAPITARGGGDFEDEVANRIPGQVFCWMMGAPASRGDQLYAISSTLINSFDGDPSNAEAFKAAIDELRSFIDELIASKRAAPADDLMSILLRAADEGILELDDVHSISTELLGASSDTTALSACRVIAQLASRPSDWARLRSDPKLIPGAIEECLRFDTVLEVDVHTSQVPTVIQGVEIPGGTIAWLGLLAANYDPAVFDEPGKFDLTRRHVRPQLNFGLGRHFCIGAALARMELEALVSVVTEEWESVDLDGVPAGPLARGARVRPLPIAVKAEP
jgi:cytochrome P450